MFSILALGRVFSVIILNIYPYHPKRQGYVNELNIMFKNPLGE